MQLLVLGGSGRSGRLIIEEALFKGHTVTALVRSAASFPLSERTGLTLVEGTPMKQEDLKKAFAASSTAPEAVLTALALKRVTDSPMSPPDPSVPPRFMEDSVANIVAVMKEFGTKRFIIMSQWGAGDSFNSMNFLFRCMFSNTNMKHGLIGHNNIDKETRPSGLDCVFVRACVLAEGDAAPIKVWPDDGKGINFLPKVTRASVAKFMVEACEKSDYVGKSPVISN
ncbi:NAD-dependent epimerase/dehydratase-like protein [Astrocystis sublimbata]|nr:NAD-dependent epimerase/dehydratase-like protein [Astrocystis sublimbata]